MSIKGRIKRKLLTILTRNEVGWEHRRNSYAQDGEDMLVASLYEGKEHYKGFYVDVGAHHPTRFSNTAYFYEKGWRGINIDANPLSMNTFREQRPEDINVECGISNIQEELTFYCFEESALNSFDVKLTEERIEQGWKLENTVVIPVKPLNDVLYENLPHQQSIDFISVDVEGFEMKILSSFDFERFAPKYWLIEDLDNTTGSLFSCQNTEITRFLASKNYIPILKSQRTIIYSKKSV